VPYLSASEVVFHYKEVLYKLYAPLPLPYLYAATNYTYLQMDGQAELTWVVVYAVRWLPIPTLTRLDVE